MHVARGQATHCLDHGIAVEGMLDWLGNHFRMDRKEALSWAGPVVNLRVTRLVNQVRGVHALLPYEALSGSRR